MEVRKIKNRKKSEYDRNAIFIHAKICSITVVCILHVRLRCVDKHVHIYMYMYMYL